MVVHPDGAIWFTDPGYGLHSNYEGDKGELELPTRTYRIPRRCGGLGGRTSPSKSPTASPSRGRPRLRLCFADTGASCGHPSQIHVFDVEDGQEAGGAGRVFHDFLAAAGPDGFSRDVDANNVWAGGRLGRARTLDGVHIVAPDGEKIGAIHLPEGAANVCFGGRKRNRLFVTGSQSLYAVYVDAQGMPYG